VTASRRPAHDDPETLIDLLADARAIPAAAYTRSRTAARTVIDLSALPVQRAAVRITAATAAFVKSLDD
jgi:hypothetical protein